MLVSNLMRNIPVARDHRASAGRRGLLAGLGDVRYSGEVIPRPTPGAPGWFRAKQQVYGPGLPPGLGSDLGTSVGIYGLLAVAGIIWLITKAK